MQKHEKLPSMQINVTEVNEKKNVDPEENSQHYLHSYFVLIIACAT